MRYQTFSHHLAGAACALLLLAACGVPPTASTGGASQTTPPAATQETPPAATQKTPPTEAELTDTVWRLVEYGPIDAPVAAGTEATATFDADGKLNGAAGCNSYFATYTLDGESLSVSEVGSTMMACMDDNVMQQESAYLAALSSATTLRYTADELIIDYAGGSLRFARQAPAAAAPLEGTSWQLTTVVTGDVAASTVAGATVTALFADSKMTGTAGCNQYSAGYSLQGEQLAVEPVVTTKMACEPAIMDQEQAFVTAVGAADTLVVVGTELRLAHAGGMLIFSAVPATP